MYDNTNTPTIYLTKVNENISEIILSVTKFPNGDFYFQAFDGTESGPLYALTQSNINWLNSTYNAYNANPQGFGLERRVWLAKQRLINSINNQNWNVATNSDEFYGLWMHYTAYESSLVEIAFLLAQTIQTATIVAGAIHQTVVAVRSFGMLINAKRTITASQYLTLSGYSSQVNNHLSGINHTNRTVITAESRNATVFSHGYTNAPHLAGTPVVGFKNSQTLQLVKVSNSGTINSGAFYVKYSDIQGLTKAQIRSKLALESTPTHYRVINIPQGTQIHTGIVGPNYGQAGGGVQFDIVGTLPQTGWWSGNSIPLP